MSMFGNEDTDHANKKIDCPAGNMDTCGRKAWTIMDRKGKCVAQNVKDRAGQLAALFVSNFGNQSSETP